MNTEFAVRAMSIGKRKGGKELWQDLSFDVERGSHVAITGASGSGKTTLLNCLGLLETPDQGSLIFNGKEIRKSSARSRTIFYRNQVGFVFQNYALVDSWSVARNLRVALTYSKQNKPSRTLMTASVLERLGLAGKERSLVYSLSGGEQQRVALARLLLKNPPLILADEPLAALDDQTASLVTSVLNECCERGAALIYSTHDTNYASTADKVIRLTP
ncbi:putative ABC transport system ATP-binding protein [Salinibacterium amurskyense]|uniref:Putative ABC transport system ATP-binding protein n=1 Tax=Salinibacterium amurskyense TaxID=205941 RepID=A0A2M9D220_9MICO|nr:ATP-binding cassette domain-containing protein [Salinibacterium amurskyense]PJJ78058.1 putative ABC transport system ATP-binding protein [Salinibacterium amurskyense]RLQ80213.1 ATP-binding cassette domain-containing protein [Salinibacterium amurskyense]GHD82433.1 ABC transporter ATP-binding protein [Salinibacterium amurskyense]